MGDLGEYWREHREYLKANGISRSRPKRRATLFKFGKKHERLGFRRCSDWHWQIRLDGDLLDYWPSKHKWRWRNVTIKGSEQELLALIARHKDKTNE